MLELDNESGRQEQDGLGGQPELPVGFGRSPGHTLSLSQQRTSASKNPDGSSDKQRSKKKELTIVD